LDDIFFNTIERISEIFFIKFTISYLILLFNFILILHNSVKIAPVSEIILDYY